MFALVEVLNWIGWAGSLGIETAARLALYGVCLLAVILLHLSRAFLQVKSKGWPGWLLGGAWLAVFALFETNLLRLPDSLRLAGGVFARQELVLSVLILGWAVCMAYVILITAHTFRNAQHPYARNRSKLWGWPVLFSIAGDMAIFAWVAWFIRSQALELPSFAMGPMLGLYLAPGYSLRLIGVVLSILIVVSQLVPKARYDPRRTLREYSLSISNILDTEVLARVAIGLIHEAFEIRSGYLFLVEFDKTENVYRLRGARGMGETTPDPGLLSPASPLVAYFLRQRQPLSQYALDHHKEYKALPAEERAWLASLEADVYIPIYAKEEWIGLLVLGPKVSGAAYGQEELEFLGTLADQTAVALHNARLVESLTRLNNEFRRAYAALERANAHLERLDRTKSDFISIASHELRTPLSVIQGYSEILIEEDLIKQNPHYAKMVAGIRSGIKRLHEIVESMLDMASIDTRSLQLSTEPVSLHVLIRMILESITKSDYDRKLEIEVEDMRHLPPLIADPEALRKVFTHLILNAIKFTPDGGKIHISGRTLPPEGNTLPEGGVEILVSDTGIGIAPEYQDLIFTKFYQTGKVSLHSSGRTKFKGGGQGLGLSIAKGIVDAHGGRIRVESPGYNEETCPGSKFYVVLPLKC